MTKKIKILLITLIFTLGLSTSSPVNAAVGVVTGSPGAIVAGALVVVFAKVSNDYSDNKLLMGLLGLIILDKESDSIQFQSIGSLEQEKNGISDTEALAYNSDLPRLNALQQEITAEVNSLPQVELKVEARRLWDEKIASRELRPETLVALQKLIN